MRWKFFFLLYTISFATEISAQGRFDRWVNPVMDSSYIDSYYKDLIIRIYWSQKYSTQTIGDNEGKLKLSCRPSNGNALRAGFTYKYVTINLG